MAGRLVIFFLLTSAGLFVMVIINLLIFRLPIPKLEDTIKRYLAAQKPLLNDEQYRYDICNYINFIHVNK